MPGFLGGLANAAAAGAAGYAEGDLDAKKRAIALAAMKRKDMADAERDKLARDEFEQRKEQDRIRNLMGGYRPGSTSVTTEEAGGGHAPAAPLPTDQTFGDVLGSMGLPTTPDRGPLDPPPVPSLGAAPTLPGADASANARELTAKLRAANRSAGAAKTLTPEMKARNAQQAAQGLLSIHGSPSAARAWLLSPDGADARAQGVKPEHFGGTAPKRGALDAPPVPPMGGVPNLTVTETPESFDPMAGSQGTLELAKEKARADALGKTLDSRESIAADNRSSRERMTANREAIRSKKAEELKTHPVTGSARLQHIARMSRQYMQPTYLGGMGLNPDAAKRQATLDIDEIIASAPVESGGKGVPLPKAGQKPNAFLPSANDPGGDIDLSTPTGFAAPSPAAPADPIDVAVQHLRDGTGTVAQLDASKKSAAFKAEVKRRYGAKK